VLVWVDGHVLAGDCLCRRVVCAGVYVRLGR
jgi:hypothetical protein